MVALTARTARLPLKTLVIVVSRTGGWADYLRATGAGAFDHRAYPQITGGSSADYSRCIDDRMASDFHKKREQVSLEKEKCHEWQTDVGFVGR